MRSSLSVFVCGRNQLQRCKNRAIRSRNRLNRPINWFGMRGWIGWLISFFIYQFLSKIVWFLAKFSRKSSCQFLGKTGRFIGETFKFRFSLFPGAFWPIFLNFVDFFKNWWNRWGPVFLIPLNFRTLSRRERHAFWKLRDQHSFLPTWDWHAHVKRGNHHFAFNQHPSIGDRHIQTHYLFSLFYPNSYNA
jgi:hypothetical protein